MSHPRWKRATSPSGPRKQTTQVRARLFAKKWASEDGEPIYRLSRADIDELNGENRRPTNKQFLLLLIGFAFLLVLLYAMIMMGKA